MKRVMEMIAPQFHSTLSNAATPTLPTYPERPTRIYSRTVDDIILLAVRGEFDISLTLALRKACQWDCIRYREYVFSLSAVTTLRDSGLALLLMFHHATQRHGASLFLCNCTPKIAKRCSAMGLLVI
jgi:anti-anti-sigma factor